jgi:hypothetical protein
MPGGKPKQKWQGQISGGVLWVDGKSPPHAGDIPVIITSPVRREGGMYFDYCTWKTTETVGNSCEIPALPTKGAHSAGAAYTERYCSADIASFA